ncbi:type III effector protein [Trinickia caryophylli]|nr:type III effector protein [Trinickia caryophylli]
MLVGLPSGAIRVESPAQRPLADIGRLAAGQMRRVADMKAVALEREVVLARHHPADSLAPGLKARVRDVAEQLAVRCAVSPEVGKSQQPVAGAWRYLQAVDAVCRKLSVDQVGEVRNELRAALAQSGHSQPDRDLLQNVIDEITRPGGQTLAQFMSERAFTGLCLPNLRMTAEGQEEPDSRTFNSVLPNLAESTFDHNPMGRTLLWEGACQLFTGPHQAQRREKLRKVVFEFPNVTKEGQSRLETPWEFMMAVDQLRVDEPVDLHALEQRS